MKNLLAFAKPKKKQLISSVVLSAIGTLFSIVPFILIYYVLTHIITNGTNGDPWIIIRTIIFGAGAVLLNYLFTVSAFVFSHIAAFDLLYDIRIKLAKHLGTLPIGFWSKNNSGKVRKIIQEDVESIENFIAHHVPDAVSGLILPVATLVFLYIVDWRLALMTTIPLILGLGMLKKMWKTHNRDDLLLRYNLSLESMHSTTVEFVRGMPVVKVFNITVKSFKRLKESILLYRELVIEWSKSMTPYWAFFSAIVLGGGIFILPLSLYLLQNGLITIPKVLIFLLLGTGCFSGFVNMMTIGTHSKMISEHGERIQSILDEKSLPEPEISIVPNNHNIRVNNLNFKYNDNTPYALKNINADFPEGSFTAIVGPSGAGKTTLVHLMSRMWDISEGEILIGNTNVKNIGTANLNNCVGTLFQDVQMLTDTVKANIIMSEQNVSDEDVINAAKVASCHDFIKNLPNGYDTIIGNGGDHHLSGGEKQRIALARIVLKNPNIILLDEATSYSDADNETLIQQAFSRIMKDKTVVVIAHRLSTIVKADNILVIDQGKIVEQGTHPELLEKGGLYNNMWQAHTRAKDWKISKDKETLYGKN